MMASVRDRHVIEGMPEKNGCEYRKPLSFDWAFENSFDYGKDGTDKGGSLGVNIARSVIEGMSEKNGVECCKPQSFDWAFENSFDYGKDGTDKGGRLGVDIARYVIEAMSEKNGGEYRKPQSFDWAFENYFDYGKGGTDKGGRLGVDIATYVIEGMSEKNGVECCRPQNFDWAFENSFDYGKDGTDKGGRLGVDIARYVTEGMPEKNGGEYRKPQSFDWGFENSFDNGKDGADKGGRLGVDIARYVIEGMSEKNGGGYCKLQSFDWEFENSFDYGKDGIDKGGRLGVDIARYVIEGMSEKNGGRYPKPQSFDWEVENSSDWGKDGTDKGRSESVPKNIIDLLPLDPFEMEISATITAIAGWVGEYERDRLNFLRNRPLSFQTEAGNKDVYERSDPIGGFDDIMGEFISGLRQDGCAVVCNAERLLQQDGSCHDVDEGAPNDALLFALGHLGVWDLLSAERVCRSLCSAIQSDVLLWKNIHISHPLNVKITDDALLRLTNRAQGNLQCLSLVACPQISDNGLNCVLQCNPRLKKLNVEGCRQLSVDGIVNNLKAFKSSGASGIDYLRIGDRYGVTREQFEELKSLVGTDKCMQRKANKPRYYHNGHSSPSCDDDRSIDIEICPRCENLRFVYDCPAESCQRKQPGTQMCRACIICIGRCAGCGRCVNDSVYEETFFLDLLCLGCRKQLPERGEEKGAYSEHTIFHHETRYCIQLRG